MTRSDQIGLRGSSLFGNIIHSGVALDSTSGQLLAIGEHDLSDAPERLAILGWYHSDRNLITRLHGLLGVAIVNHGGRIFSLRTPLHHLAVVICYVELKYDMGIGPKPFCNGPLESNALLHVICRSAMVCE